MKGDFDGELRRRMHDATMLPPDRPIQQRVRRDIADAGNWAHEEWLELQQESAEVRLALHAVALPTGLEQRLLDIPMTSAQRHRRRRVPFAAVAAVLMIVAVSALVVSWSHESSTNRSITRVASLMAIDHASRPELTILADETWGIVEQMQPIAPFEIRLAAAPIGATLIGGRICRFDAGPLILTRWHTAERELSLYQLRLADFGLAPNIPRREIDTFAGDEDKGHCRVRLWSDDHFAYAIVSDAPVPEDGS